MAMMTAKDVQGLKTGQCLLDPAARGLPKLEARGGTPRAKFYLRYTDSEGRRDRLFIGSFDGDGRGGLTLVEAREQAGLLARRYAAGERDLRATLEAEEAARRAAEAAEQEAASVADNLTLAALVRAYADHLTRNGKNSADRVRRALIRHVIEAAPKIAGKAAADVTGDDALTLLELLTEAGKRREAEKLRAYLRAGFGAALNARRAPGALPALRTIGQTLTTNPVRDLGTVPGSSKRRDRALSVAELRAYWHRLRDLEAPAGPLLRLHLLTGAQRLEQLARATVADVDKDDHALLLLDSKGRRTEPRRHWVPLLPEAREAIAELRRGNRGPYVFTASLGERPACGTTVAHMLRRVSAAMVVAKEAEPFTAGDIRRTVETRLAALGVPLEVRAHLQSHGLGGVQARHYDRHDYAAEKRDALRQLLTLLEGKPASVTPIRRAKART